jgi:two-component system, NarL family, nitrate/nitrite response regulator NarL
MPNPLRIAIADDHQIVIDGLKLLLKDEPGYEIVVETNQPELMVSLLKKHPADILLTDVMMPVMNGCELAREVRRTFPAMKILALSMSGQADLVNQMIEESDINGYVLKNIGRSELITAINKIAAGGIYFSEQVLNDLTQFSQDRKKNEEVHLTAREIEIIKCIEKEMSNKDISEALFISERTVETHRKNIFRKTGANGVIGLIKYAYQHKLI